MKKPTLRLLPLLAAVTLLGCGDETPTVTTPLTTPDPLTFEVHLPWSEFASNLRVVGGYGGPAQTRRGLLAHEFDNGLEARTLLRLGAYPSSVEVVDSLGTRRSETDISLVSGSLWMTVDTTEVDDVAPTTVTLGRLLEPWHARSATWALASDSGGVQVPWSEPGGGAVETLRRLTWFPQGREILIGLDSADIALIGDTTLAERGLIVSIESPGHRLYVPEVRMEVHAVPGINEDSTLFVPVDVTELTYVYTPSAAPPSGIHLRAGGAPAWRSLFTLALPRTLPGTGLVCARTTCPVTLGSTRVNHASLLLTTRPTDRVAFAPADTMGLEVRGVLAPELLPKSPVTDPLFVDSLGFATGATVPAEAFRPGSSRVVEVPITPIVHSLLAGASFSAFRPTPTVALMQLREPNSFAYASFVGPGQPGEPVLRLVLTISDPLGLP